MSSEIKGSNAMEKEIRVLHLEDDGADAELIYAALESAGIPCKITRVQSSGEFSGALHMSRYDLILADYRLPSYDGISALHYVRERYSDIPFIFISGTMGEDAAIQALTEGATDYVLKQKLSRLAPAVRRALRDAENRTERRRAEESLRESEERFRAVANSANDGIVSTDSQGIMFYWNKAAHTMFGYTDEEILGQSLTMLIPEQYREAYQDVLKYWFTNYENRQLSKTVEAVGRRKDGNEFPIELSVGSWNTREGTFFTGIVRDITERKRAEEALRRSEEKFRALAENIPNVVYQCRNDSRYTFLYLNEAIEDLTGYPRKAFLENGLSFFDLYHPDDLKTMPTPEDNNITDINGAPFHITYRIRHKSGEWRWVDEWGIGVTNANGKVEFLEGVMIDITERKHYELEREAIITVSQALRKATTRTEILTVILDQVIELFEADGSMLGLPNPIVGGVTVEIGRGVVGERFSGLSIPPGEGVSGWVIANKKPYLNDRADVDSLFYRPDLLGNSHCVASVPLIAKEQAIGVLWIARQISFVEQDLRLLNAIADIAANAIHRVMLHEQTEQQLHHLIALHQIDIAISANFDFSITLNVILNNVKEELEVDAASILLLDPVTHTLDYAAGIGFRTRSIEQSHVKIGDGYTGRAAQEYRTVSCPDLRLARETFSRSSLLADEEFVAHYATPLVVKGQVKGVLELFHRKTFELEPEWISYFETFATQSAIAIESASLFENLQRSNTELMLAYDATIEGWSRALDLRDRETEGHTQRVTEMALILAEKMEISDAEKMNLRRGALLHDIGKMGVPDSILLKPAPLLENEQEIMRQHPLYAYQMLSPITYLKHALEIPYCHHEKWDGSGYPRGLKGDEIPLSARLFSVVDVFDALTSDRPYRKAWPREDVYRYIQEQAGKHFDPQVVKIFLEVK